MVPDDAGPVPYQLVMRPLRGERTISVAKGRLEEVEGAERGFSPLLYDISEQVGLLPSSPGGTMAPETIVPFELTLASVLRESSKSIAWFRGFKRHILYRIDLGDGRGSSHQSCPLHREQPVQARQFA
jgi:hypothetical protein